MIKPLLELVNTDLLLLPRSLSSSVQEIKFKVHLKEKSTGEARKDLGKSFRGLLRRWNLLFKKIMLSSGASPFLNTSSKPSVG